MKGFQREDLSFSLCGLNCALCPMELGGHCPGCGGGEGNQPCAIARCSLEHGAVLYCWQCAGFPCERSRGDDPYDSFITHLHRRADLERCRDMGPAAYGRELAEKRAILSALLAGYNDGRRKSLYCLAVNLLPLDDLRQVMKHLALLPPDLTVKEWAAQAAGLLQVCARENGVELKLRRKPKGPAETGVSF